MTDALTQVALDQDGHLCNHLDWTPLIAQELANSLSITLTQTHYQILMQVRDFYQKYHHSPATRPLIKHLMATLPELKLDNQTLQKLFNTGLVARHVNRIAGLPKPPNCL